MPQEILSPMNLGVHPVICHVLDPANGQAVLAAEVHHVMIRANGQAAATIVELPKTITSNGKREMSAADPSVITVATGLTVYRLPVVMILRIL